MTVPLESRFPRWVTAVFMFVITFVLTTLTYFIDIVATLYYFIVILLVLVFWLYIDKQLPEDLGFRLFSGWWLQLLLGVLVAGITLGFVIWLEVLLGWLVLTPIFLEYPLELVAGMLSVYAINQGLVAFGEEALSRGYIQQNLETRLRMSLSILIASFMFALFHVPGIFYYGLPPISAVIMFVNLLLGGLMLGLAFAQTRNLWLPIGLHAGWNFMLYHIVGVRGDGLFQYQSVGLEVLTGGIAGPEAGLVGTAGFLFLIGVVWIGSKSSGRQLLRLFERKPLLMFAFGFLVILIPVVLGLLVA